MSKDNRFVSPSSRRQDDRSRHQFRRCRSNSTDGADNGKFSCGEDAVGNDSTDQECQRSHHARWNVSNGQVDFNAKRAGRWAHGGEDGELNNFEPSVHSDLKKQKRKWTSINDYEGETSRNWTREDGIYSTEPVPSNRIVRGEDSECINRMVNSSYGDNGCEMSAIRQSSRSSASSKFSQSPAMDPPKPLKDMTVKMLKKKREQLMSSKFGYTNENNPFGDATLADPFVWKKKLKYERAVAAGGREKEDTPQGVNSNVTPATLMQTAIAKVTEIEAVKKRREEREEEEKILEAQKEEMAREREAEAYEDWHEKERIFHREMVRKKTDIRIEEGRSKPIDLIVKGLSILGGEKEYEDTRLLDLPPYEHIYNELENEDDIKEFEKDIKIHIHHNDAAPSIDIKFENFWRSLLVVTQDALCIARSGRSASLATAQMLDCVRDEVDSLLSGQSVFELGEMEKDVADKLSRMDDGTDPTFWEAVQRRLPLFKARAEILRIHRASHKAAEEMMRRVLARKQAEGLGGSLDGEGGDELLSGLLGDSEVDRETLIEKVTETSRKLEIEVNENHDGALSPELEPYDDNDGEVPLKLPESGQYSPILHSYAEFKNYIHLHDPLEERRQRLLQKKLITKRMKERRGFAHEDFNTLERGSTAVLPPPVGIDQGAKALSYDEFVRREKKTMGDDEEIMAATSEELIKSHYAWEDKYRPRKPRFFNRVKTGFEWNKYNQTHYEHENPPPKTVQGYKFNIFYPDLIDPTITPSWKLEPSDIPNSLIIRFHAGPPYEDIAFRVINREWNMDRRRGFRNTFDKGWLDDLWF